MSYLNRYFCIGIFILCSITAGTIGCIDGISVKFSRVRSLSLWRFMSHLGHTASRTYEAYEVTMVNQSPQTIVLKHADIVKEKSLSVTRAKECVSFGWAITESVGLIGLCALIGGCNYAIQEKVRDFYATEMWQHRGFNLLTALGTVPTLIGIYDLCQRLADLAEEVPFQDIIDQILPETVTLKPGQEKTYLVFKETGIICMSPNGYMYIPHG